MTRLIDADEFFKNYPELDIEPYNNTPTAPPVDENETLRAYQEGFFDGRFSGLAAQPKDLARIYSKTELIYSAMIPLNPTTKKNSQKIINIRKNGKTVPMITQGEKYRHYETEAGWFLKTRRQPIDYPVNVRCLFYRKGAQRVDLTNLLEAVDDILVKYKIIKDDNFQIIAGHDGSRVYIDKDKPRTEIYIEKISKYNKTEGGTP